MSYKLVGGDQTLIFTQMYTPHTHIRNVLIKCNGKGVNGLSSRKGQDEYLLEIERAVSWNQEDLKWVA